MNPTYYPLKKQTARQVNIPRGVYDPDSKEGKKDPYFGQHNSILYQKDPGGKIDFDYIPIVFIIDGKSYELLGAQKNYEYDKFGIITMGIDGLNYDILCL